MADTKELVERLRAHTETVDMYGTLRAVDVCLNAADAIEHLERERNEANANARMYEATAKEAAFGLECLSDIDDAWDAIGSRGNRKSLTLAEQISSLARELDDADAEVATLRARVAKMEGVLARHREDREYVIGWNDGFDHALTKIVSLQFPTMLRKMWSGGEVQAFLDARIADARAALTEEQL